MQGEGSPGADDMAPGVCRQMRPAERHPWRTEMTQPVSELEIERLTVPERLELIGRLWDSIPDSSEALPVPDWHRQELEKRLDAADAAPEAGVPWQQARERL